MHITRIIAFFAISITSTVAIANIDQTVSDIHELTHKTRVAKHAIENFNGGIPSAMKIANAIFKAHTASEIARSHLKESDAFSSSDGDQTMKAYEEFYPVLISTLQAGQAKAPEMKQRGLGYIARGMLSNLYQEKDQLEDAMLGQLSTNHTRILRQSIGEADTAFRLTIDYFS
ncbi:hypothetical protein N7450_011261 [Penicillium hetheringtonii]|uniref:Uncharacterized protein n=1 Tax=Penicillium hetheringtonii TaxID=911720 RepID=A0AAD6GN53_9EURO|nr:hypothetical protein N7450_011261 [Penicillium hetheringtonii]